MYRNSYQRGILSVFFSVGSKPLAIWETHIQDGYITRFLDQDIKSMVLEVGGTNVSTTYITCPKGNQVLGITMPFLVMIVKNLKKYFSFEVTILDETLTRRRFRVSNFQSTTQILPLCTVMPIGLSEGWNQIQFNLAEFTRRAYKKQFVEVQKLKINANIRIRRIYFTERLIADDELPPEYKLYFPLTNKGAKGKKIVQEQVSDKPSLSQQTHATGRTESRTTSKASIHSAKKTPSQIKPIMEEAENVEEKKEEQSEEVKQNVEEQKEEQSKEVQHNVEEQPEDVQQNVEEQKTEEQKEVKQNEASEETRTEGEDKAQKEVEQAENTVDSTQ